MRRVCWLEPSLLGRFLCLWVSLLHARTKPTAFGYILSHPTYHVFVNGVAVRRAVSRIVGAAENVAASHGVRSMTSTL
jgi:hypothetical protein